MFAIFVDPPRTGFNCASVEPGARGSTAPRLTAPAVSERDNSRKVVASVESAHLILTEFERGLSGNAYESVGFSVPIFQELASIGELMIGVCVEDETHRLDPVAKVVNPEGHGV